MSKTPKQLTVILQKRIHKKADYASYLLRWEMPHLECAQAGQDGAHFGHRQWGMSEEVDIVAGGLENPDLCVPKTLEDFVKRLRLDEGDIRLLALFTDSETPEDKRVRLIQKENCLGGHELVIFWRGGLRVPIKLTKELATIVEYLSAEIEDPDSEIAEQVSTHVLRATITIELGDDYVDE